jgi:hypothetical protein
MPRLRFQGQIESEDRTKLRETNKSQKKKKKHPDIEKGEKLR